jgi:hypothetical protein
MKKIMNQKLSGTALEALFIRLEKDNMGLYSPQPTWLTVGENQVKEVKNLGGRWDPSTCRWFVPVQEPNYDDSTPMVGARDRNVLPFRRWIPNITELFELLITIPLYYSTISKIKYKISGIYIITTLMNQVSPEQLVHHTRVGLDKLHEVTLVNSFGDVKRNIAMRKLGAVYPGNDDYCWFVPDGLNPRPFIKFMSEGDIRKWKLK